MSDTALVVGEALIDVVQHAGQPLGEHVGGSPLNVAVGLALLGRRVEFLTWIGDDDRGRRIADYLHDGGVDLAEGSVGASRTATALAELDETGSATYQFDIEWRLPSKPGVSAPLVLHTGSIATALEPGCGAVAELIDTHSRDDDDHLRPERPARVLRERRGGTVPRRGDHRPLGCGEGQRRGHTLARPALVA